MKTSSEPCSTCLSGLVTSPPLSIHWSIHCSIRLTGLLSRGTFSVSTRRTESPCS
ncbi:hypothetical protein LEMLEM_LOCUS6379 [Lemmus lemmus]